jgi:SNF2 family DNA or RNA helicase
MPARLEPVFRYPPMTPKQATAYKQLRKQALAELDGVEIVPKGTLAVFGRMCQLASAMIEVADGEDKDGFTREVVSMTLPSSKADDLLDYLKDHEGSLVVAANSPALIGLAERKLNAAKITTCKIIGGMSAEEKDQAAKWFQDGTCRVAFINQAGAEAITLTRSATVFFMQPEPGFRAREQKIGRVDRIGQDRPVQVVNSITPGTVEQQLYELGTQREERATQVTRDADLMRWIIAPGQPAAEDRQEVLDLE